MGNMHPTQTDKDVIDGRFDSGKNVDIGRGARSQVYYCSIPIQIGDEFDKVTEECLADLELQIYKDISKAMEIKPDLLVGNPAQKEEPKRFLGLIRTDAI